MTNESLNPNSFLKAHFTDTYLCNGNVKFNDVFENVANNITGIFGKNDTSFVTPLGLKIPNFIKRINLRVFSPSYIAYPDKFVAHYNLTGTLYGTPSLTPRLFLLDGSEIEVYGIVEIRKIILMTNNVTDNPYLLNISLFK